MMKNNVPFLNFSDLEKYLFEIEKLQKENRVLLIELEFTRLKVLEMQRLAQIESKIYFGIKKIFR